MRFNRHAMGASVFLFLGSAVAGAQGWNEPFNSSTLDPAWEVRQTYPGGTSRPGGYTSPANHYSLEANPGSLRYLLDPMTHQDGFISGYQSDTLHSCCMADPALELHRGLSGEAWVLESKVSFHLPFTNGRQLEQRVYFGDGGTNTFVVRVSRGRDVNQDYLVLSLVRTTGPNGVTDYTLLESASVSFYPNEAPPTWYFRIQRAGGVVALHYGTDGSNWTVAFTHDLGTQLNGLGQRVVIVGASWFNTAGSYADWDYLALTPLTPTGATLSATFSTTTAYPGDPVSVALNIQNAESLYAAQADCGVSPLVLAPQSAVFGSFFDPVNRLIGASQANAGAGTWLGAISQRSPAGPLSGNGLLATVEYTAVSPGQTSISCDPLFSNRDGLAQPVSFSSAGDVTVLRFATISGTATYQGRTQHAGISVCATGPVTRCAVTDASGAFLIDQLRDGLYHVVADAALHLPRDRTDALAAGQALALPGTVLKGGDANEDGIINIGDATLVAFNFGLLPPAVDQRADINSDGVVNVQDLAILAGNYELSAPVAW